MPKIKVLSCSLTLVTVLCCGLIVSLQNVALGSSPVTSGGNLAACYNTASVSASVSMAGRNIPPNSILLVAGGNPCPSGETTLGLASYTATILVSNSGNPTQNGTALLNALSYVAGNSPSASNPWLIKLEPGNFDLGTQPLTMLPFVDLEGSGKDITTIQSQVTTAFPPTSATINLVNNSEIRMLTVNNTSTGATAATVRGNGVNSTARITGVKINAGLVTANNFSISLFLSNSSPVLNTLEINTGPGNTFFGTGLYNFNGSSPNIQNSMISVTGNRSQSEGIYNYGASNPTISNTSVNVSSTLTNSGKYFAMVNDSSNPVIQGSIITVSGAGNENYGILNQTGASASIFSSKVLVSGTGTTITALQNSNNSPGSNTLVVQNSVIQGQTYSINNQQGIAKVGASQLDGPVYKLSDILCVATYDGTYNPLTCG